MQLHKRQTIEQVRLLFDWYEQGLVSRTEAEEKLGIKRRRFFELLKLYRTGKLTTITTIRTNKHRRIPETVEAAIKVELAKEQRLINNKDMTVGTYNYRAVRDAVTELTGKSLSAQTVRNRAKDWGYYRDYKIVCVNS